jgi:hypothetical protein
MITRVKRVKVKPKVKLSSNETQGQLLKMEPSHYAELPTQAPPSVQPTRYTTLHYYELYLLQILQLPLHFYATATTLQLSFINSCSCPFMLPPQFYQWAWELETSGMNEWLEREDGKTKRRQG